MIKADNFDLQDNERYDFMADHLVDRTVILQKNHFFGGNFSAQNNQRFNE